MKIVIAVAFLPLLYAVVADRPPGGVKPFAAKIMQPGGAPLPITVWAKDYFDAKRQLESQCRSPCRILEDVREER